MNLFQYLLEPANWTYSNNGIWGLIVEHLFYTVVAVAIAAVIGIPLGILIGHTGRGNLLVIGVSNAARAIPTLGLLVLVVLVLSTGKGPIVGVLAVLALPPILTATSAGVRGADPGAVHAARAMGMTGGQMVRQVEWPLALPLVVSGLRSATLQVVATATVAGFVSGGALGRLVISGQSSNDYPQMFAGAALVALLAIVLDLLLGLIGRMAARRANPKSPATEPIVVPT